VAETRTVRESVVLPLISGDVQGEDRAMVSNNQIDGFACTLVPTRILPDHAVVSEQALLALNMTERQLGRVRSFDV
jgi:arginine/ornithine N-succinyltransferase beta subunit